MQAGEWHFKNKKWKYSEEEKWEEESMEDK